MSLKDQILAANDVKAEPVAVPEWNCTVFIKTMSGHDRDHWESLAFPEGKPVEHGYRVTLLLVALVDEKGERVFSDADINLLSGKSSGVINRLYDVAARMNGLTRTDEEAAIKN
jgi:hypothetical protein